MNSSRLKSMEPQMLASAGSCSSLSSGNRPATAGACSTSRGREWPKPVWVVDVHDESRLTITGTLPLPPVSEFAERGGRFGAHNLHENHPLPTALRSETLVYGAYFNAGVRVHDVSNPCSPVEVATTSRAGGRAVRHGADERCLRGRERPHLRYRTLHRGLYILEGTF